VPQAPSMCRPRRGCRRLGVLEVGNGSHLGMLAGKKKELVMALQQRTDNEHSQCNKVDGLRCPIGGGLSLLVCAVSGPT